MLCILVSLPRCADQSILSPSAPTVVSLISCFSFSNLSLSLFSSVSDFRVTDAEAVAMSRHLALHDGLFLGSSAAVNLVACVRLAQSESFRKEAGKVIVTILWYAPFSVTYAQPLTLDPDLCLTFLSDSGTRHLSKFWYVFSCRLFHLVCGSF